MEFKIVPYTMPEAVVFNFTELKAAIQSKCSDAASIAYTEDQIGEAKKDKAELNKLSTALNTARIAEEKKFMAPFNEFKAQVNELRNDIANAVRSIDIQIDAAEENRKAVKMAEIQKVFAEEGFPEFVTLDKVMDKRWLNKGCSISTIKGEMSMTNARINCDLSAIAQFSDFRAEAEAEYQRTLSLSHTLEFRAHLIQIREDTEAAASKMRQAVTAPTHMDAPPAEEPAAAQWVAFEALITPEQGKLLRQFVNQQGIKIRPVSK